MSKRKRTSDEENTDRWLLTYADLLTLLLGFFVVMYSMSRIDAKQFGRMAQNLQGVFDGGHPELENSGTPDLGAGVLKVGDLKLLQQKVRRLSEIIEEDSSKSLPAGQESVPGMITSEIDERGLVIHIMESALFESGKAELLDGAKRMFDELNKDLAELSNHVRVEGHTDNRPISTFRYPSNWELSTARAAAVVRYFTEKHRFPTDRMSALGYGEYRPLAPNDTPANQAKNRRVDIVVLTDNLSRLEPEAEAQTRKPRTPQNKLQRGPEILSVTP